jgi:four helix bundle protein
MSNIAEGFNSRTTGQFVNLLGRARGSASEVQAQLYVALDREYVNQEQFEEAYDLADKVSRQIYRFTQYLESQSDEGSVNEPAVSYAVSEEHIK